MGLKFHLILNTSWSNLLRWHFLINFNEFNPVCQSDWTSYLAIVDNRMLHKLHKTMIVDNGQLHKYYCMSCQLLMTAVLSVSLSLSFRINKLVDSNSTGCHDRRRKRRENIPNPYWDCDCIVAGLLSQVAWHHYQLP